MPGFIETSVLDSYKQESSNKNLDTIGGLDGELDDLMREDHKTSVGGVDTLICAVDDNAQYFAVHKHKSEHVFIYQIYTESDSLSPMDEPYKKVQLVD